MFVRHIVLAGLCLAAQACTSPGDRDTDIYLPSQTSSERDQPRVDPNLPTGDPTELPPPGASTSCLSGAVRTKAERLYQAVDDAVHELITCGRAQVGMARTMAFSILLSNPDAIDLDDDTRQLFELLQSLLSGGSAELRWTRDASLAMSASQGGRTVDFAVRFLDGRLPIGYDPLRLQSYLEGVVVEASLTHDEMMADKNAKNTYTFTFDGPGPLAYLLSDADAVLEAGQFQLEMSVNDVIDVLFGDPEADVDFGPFEGLADVIVESDVGFVEDAAGTVVEYASRGRRSSVAELTSSSSVDFDLLSFTASRGELELQPVEEDITFVKLGALAGTVSWEITDDAGRPVATVVSDFGPYGKPYPTVRWTCPE